MAAIIALCNTMRYHLAQSGSQYILLKL